MILPFVEMSCIFLFGRGKEAEALPVGKPAQQECTADPLVYKGIAAVGRQSLAAGVLVVEQHDPLGQETAHCQLTADKL